MVRVTVELLPGGDEKRARHLGTAIIANDGTGNVVIGNYSVVLSKWGMPDKAWKTGSLQGFSRKTRGPWDLLYLALKSIVGNRNP